MAPRDRRQRSAADRPSAATRPGRRDRPAATGESTDRPGHRDRSHRSGPGDGRRRPRTAPSSRSATSPAWMPPSSGADRSVCIGDPRPAVTPHRPPSRKSSAMVEYDAFESRLADALRDYAAELPVEVDAAAVARSIARGRPRRSGWRTMAIPLVPTLPLVWVLLATLLLLGTALALVAVGSLVTRDDFAVDPAHPIPRPSPASSRPSWRSRGPRPAISTTSGSLSTSTRTTSCTARTHRMSAPTSAARTTPPPRGRVVSWPSIHRTGSGRAGHPLDRAMWDARYHLVFDDEGITFTRPDDPCADRVAILTTTSWRHRALALDVGERYGSWFFTEPFHFLMPQMEQGGGPMVRAFYWYAPGRLRISHPYWRTWFIDDQSVYADICDPSRGTLADVPATPEAVGDWLRSSSGTTVSPPVEIVVDGRTALRFDLVQSETCVRRTDPSHPTCSPSTASASTPSPPATTRSCSRRGPTAVATSRQGRTNSFAR